MSVDQILALGSSAVGLLGQIRGLVDNAKATASETDQARLSALLEELNGEREAATADAHAAFEASQR